MEGSEKTNLQIQNRALRILFIFLGHLSLLLGALGIILPGLPTTPFVLLSAYLFLRSSPRFYSWLISHPRFGPIIIRFQEGKGISLRLKIYALSMAYLFVGISIILVDIVFFRLFLMGIIAVATLYMIRIPTYHPEKSE
ncbi:MAG: YbaN family protein [Spirochaetales bacterium]|nr:YbaN family protein [Spirochaetales bacterium]